MQARLQQWWRMSEQGRPAVQPLTIPESAAEPVRMVAATISRAGAQLGRHWVLLNSAMGVALGGYLWQFLATNQDYTGPLPINLPMGLVMTFLVGPSIAWSIQILSALVLACLSGRSFSECLRRDTSSLVPFALLGLSPLVGGLTGLHATAYHAGVVILVSLSFSGCLALKAAISWAIFQDSPRRPHLGHRRARWVLAVAMVGFSAVFSLLQILRYNAYQLWGPDHSLVTQALWNTCHGNFLLHTYYGIEDLSLLAEQFVAIYLLLIPIYCMLPNPSILLVIQAIALAAGAWPVYRLALRRLERSSLALVWALIYLLLPMTVIAAQNSAGAIRPDILAIPIFAFMLDALDRGAWWIFGLTVVLAFASKQYLSLLVAMLGLYLAFTQKRRLFGFSLFVLGVAWFVMLMQWIMPAIHRGPALTLALQYGPEVGESGILGMVEWAIKSPGQLLSRVLYPPFLAYLFFLLFTLAGLPLLDPKWLLPTLPIVGIFAVALHSPSVNLGDHHFLPTLPFLLVAALGGAVRIKNLAARWLGAHQERSKTAVTAFALGMGLMGSLFWSNAPWTWTFWDSRHQVSNWKSSYEVNSHAKLADQFVARVPPESPVLASDYLLTHLANRPQIYMAHWLKADVLERVDYAVFDLLQNHAAMGTGDKEEVRTLLDTLLLSDDFALTAYQDGLLFFERGAHGSYINQAEMVTAREVQPEVPVGRDLGDRVRLIGYDPPDSQLKIGDRVRVVYYWEVLDGFDSPFEIKLGVSPQSVESHHTDYVAADRFEGPGGAFQSIHLPLYVQHPPSEWRPGQLIQETCEFRLPETAEGEYVWQIGLYAAPDYLGIRIRPDREVPSVVPIVLGTLQVEP